MANSHDGPDVLRADRQALSRHLDALARERSPLTRPGVLDEALDYIEREFRGSGLEIEEDSFDFEGASFHNLLGLRKAGAGEPWIVVAAHVDAVPGSPGADDNASGVAALLESARLLSTFNSAATVCFAAVNLEEFGMAGSRHLANRLSRGRLPVGAMLSLEMVGYADQRQGSQQYPFLLRPFYPSEGNFIGLVGNWSSRRLLRRVARSFREDAALPVETLTVPFNGWLLPTTRLSDHAPFWDQGFPALLVTDTAFFRNPHYHLPSDTVATLDLDFLARVTEAVARTVADLATEEPENQ